VAGQAAACSCLRVSPLQALERSTTAFVGRAISLHDPSEGKQFISSADPVYYTFAVDLAWKGAPADTVVLRTNRDGASCGTEFELGHSYIVYARDYLGELMTGLCSGNGRIDAAVEHRFYLPQPHVRRPGAVWPPLYREDLLDLVAGDQPGAAYGAGQLLAELLLPPGRPSYDLGLLFKVAAADLNPVLLQALDAGKWSPAILEDPVRELARGPEGPERRQALAALVAMVPDDQLVPALLAALAEPELEPQEEGGGGYLLGHPGERAVVTVDRRLAEMPPDQARRQLADLCRAYPVQGEFARRKILIRLNLFPVHADLIEPFARAVQDTATADWELDRVGSLLNSMNRK
jgi:hypothetical protein